MRCESSRLRCRGVSRIPLNCESLARDRIAAEPRAALEYVQIVDPATLAPVDVVEHPAVVLIAARFGDVRLIDNLPIAP